MGEFKTEGIRKGQRESRRKEAMGEKEVLIFCWGKETKQGGENTFRRRVGAGERGICRRQRGDRAEGE